MRSMYGVYLRTFTYIYIPTKNSTYPSITRFLIHNMPIPMDPETLAWWLPASQGTRSWSMGRRSKGPTLELMSHCTLTMKHVPRPSVWVSNFSPPVGDLFLGPKICRPLEDDSRKKTIKHPKNCSRVLGGGVRGSFFGCCFHVFFWTGLRQHLAIR